MADDRADASGPLDQNGPDGGKAGRANRSTARSLRSALGSGARSRNGSGGDTERRSGSGDSGGGTPTGKEAAPPTSPPSVRLLPIADNSPSDNTPKGENKKQTDTSQTPKKPAKITQALRQASARSLAEKSCDLSIFVAGFVAPTPTDALGFPLSAMTAEERDKIEPALANVLSRYDWVARADMGSDWGALLAACSGYALRLYMTNRMMKMQRLMRGEPEPPKPPLNIMALFRKPKPAPEHPPEAEMDPVFPDNGRPPDADLSSVGFASIAPGPIV